MTNFKQICYIKTDYHTKAHIIKECRLQDSLYNESSYPKFKYYNVRYEFYLLPNELLFKNTNLKKRDLPHLPASVM